MQREFQTSLLRISAGIGDSSDLIADLDRAFQSVTKGVKGNHECVGD